MTSHDSLIPYERIERSILLIRGRKVILDKDLAEMYNVETFNLNKAVKRNIDRFPPDFMFQLTREEFNNLKFHFGISRWGGTRKLPYAFTDLGIAMLSRSSEQEKPKRQIGFKVEEPKSSYAPRKKAKQ